MLNTTVSNGTTESERYLAHLGKNSFLSLWCYPNLYTDEGKKAASGVGKELCDMLVVFGNQILIFSDKDIIFKNTGNLEVDWSRWLRRAVLKSAPQIYGAENFIKRYPDRIYLDRKCTQRFPIDLNDSQKFIFHRIIVARNAVKRFREYGGGSGSLILDPKIKGKDMEKTPFHVGTIDESKGFVHIFDDLALDVIMQELDTISDLTQYFTEKQKFIESGNLGLAAGEEDLLGFYLGNSDKNQQPTFNVDVPGKCIIAEGHYDFIRSLPQYEAGKIADEKSYFVDRLIEHFAKHVFDNTWEYNNTQTFEETISGLRVLASETRLGRRVIAKSILDKVTSLRPDQRGVRLIASPLNEKIVYVFFVLPIPDYAESYQEYREVRQSMLTIYCNSAKLLMPEKEIIVGLATDPPQRGTSEDMVYIDTKEWTEQDFKDAEKDREDFGFLKAENMVMHESKEYQFPIEKKQHKITKNKSKNIRKRKRKTQNKSRKRNRN